MLIHYRQHSVRLFRGQQDDPSALNMGDAEDIDDDKDTIVRDADESDYGSELDDATVDELLTSAFAQEPHTPLPTVKQEEVEEEPVLPERVERDEEETYPLVLSRAVIEALQLIRTVELPVLNGNTHGPTSPARPPKATRLNESDPFTVQTGGSPIKRETSPIETPVVNDTRTPRERFRKQRPLTVTDLVTPAWCELKYWYSLTKHGRVKQTPAMRQGSKIHKKLEQQTQVEVRIEVETKEDRMGLRLWNIIQGLRGLRATGLTRELEVFSVVDGDVVVGVIDALSYTCPDDKFEAELLEMQESAQSGSKKEELPADQRTLTDFFGSSQEQAIFNSQAAWGDTPRRPQPARTIYITDVKTRGVNALPSGKRMQSTQLQLMLYRRLLNELAANKVAAQSVFDRYGMDPMVRFSDTFIAHMAAIDFSSSRQPPPSELDDENDEMMTASDRAPADALDEVTTYNTLSLLWSHMIKEFQTTIPPHARPACVSPLLTAEFRAKADGALIGRRSFAYDADALDQYVVSELAWWRGERAAQGVDIEEASYKCGSCEFAAECSWRLELDRKFGQQGKLT